jgi:hypothetical protein
MEETYKQVAKWKKPVWKKKTLWLKLYGILEKEYALFPLGNMSQSAPKIWIFFTYLYAINNSDWNNLFNNYWLQLLNSKNKALFWISVNNISNNLCLYGTCIP